MNIPPPLPADGFLNALARTSLAVSLAGLAAAVLQTLLSLLLPDAAVARLALQPGVPGALVRILELRHVLSLASLLLAALFLASSWGLLKRQDWARRMFIVLLVATALANFAGLALIGPMLDSFEKTFPAHLPHAAGNEQFMARMQVSRMFGWFSGVVGALAVAGLHGWVVWKLCTAPVRAAFGRPAGARAAAAA